MVLGIGIELEQVEAHKEIQNEVVRVSLYRYMYYTCFTNFFPSEDFLLGG